MRCLDPESIAALADGSLRDELARRDALAHLAGCEACRELFSATWTTLDELDLPRAAMGSLAATPGPAPAPRSWRGVQGAMAMAASILVAFGLGLPRARELPLDSGLTEPARAVAHLTPLDVERSLGGLASSPRRLGALWTEIEVAAVAGARGEARLRLAELSRQLARMAGTEGLAERAKSADGSASSVRGLGIGLRTRFPGDEFALGTWAQRVRLATLTGDVRFFARYGPRGPLAEGSAGLEAALNPLALAWPKPGERPDPSLAEVARTLIEG